MHIKLVKLFSHVSLMAYLALRNTALTASSITVSSLNTNKVATISTLTASTISNITFPDGSAMKHAPQIISIYNYNTTTQLISNTTFVLNTTGGTGLLMGSMSLYSSSTNTTGTVTFSFTGPSTYTYVYNWNNYGLPQYGIVPVSFTTSVSGLVAGTYTVSVTFSASINGTAASTTCSLSLIAF